MDFPPAPLESYFENAFKPPFASLLHEILNPQKTSLLQEANGKAPS